MNALKIMMLKWPGADSGKFADVLRQAPLQQAPLQVEGESLRFPDHRSWRASRSTDARDRRNRSSSLRSPKTRAVSLKAKKGMKAQNITKLRASTSPMPR